MDNQQNGQPQQGSSIFGHIAGDVAVKLAAIMITKAASEAASATMLWWQHLSDNEGQQTSPEVSGCFREADGTWLYREVTSAPNGKPLKHEWRGNWTKWVRTTFAKGMMGGWTLKERVEHNPPPQLPEIVAEVPARERPVTPPGNLYSREGFSADGAYVLYEWPRGRNQNAVNCVVHFCDQHGTRSQLIGFYNVPLPPEA